MAITAPNATYLTQGPNASGQILASNPASDTEVALPFTATVTLDGTTTTFNLNFIDGTKTLSYVPSAVMLTVVGGTQATVVGVSTGTPTNVLVPVTISAAGTNANTIKLAGFILK